ncbi:MULTISPECIES: DUF1002 domain-containing protein [Priestia]|uniref:Uncharacterized protein n=3 Tax=Priestia TaxID=2800373 RepID=A0A0H4L064_9BACI|nr:MULTISPECIES: DUF1002 domain-containing protein [Priestia]AKO94013.1 hypothetical protein BEH_19120 [Priestia filamentosa]KAB2493727.1 DUF1002 domain-containing protein [Priestia endophytica]KYG35942.1 hypothetical protein AZF06_01730 [Priestia endophytica]MBG9814886.1 hypothetical protein [Priestia endophytica]MCY8232800.1 DUF1002 domain-containing protein [Priestia endophytica]
MKKCFKLLLAVLISLTILPSLASADAAVGDVIVTLGENLTQEQKTKLLNEMEVPQDAQEVTVSNAEEHEYLGDFIPKSQIGTKAISSASITLGEKDSGLNITTNNINWVTDEMYTNALITAGVKDAKIYITAPFEVSGTAALTGILKAYEVQSGEEIPEDVKKIANEEMVETSQLGDSVGKEKAAALMANVKEEIAKNTPENKEEIKQIIENNANELNINLTTGEINSLVNFFNKLTNIDINWNQIENQFNVTKEKVSDFLNSEEGQSFLQKLKEFFMSIINAIRSFFASLF